MKHPVNRVVHTPAAAASFALFAAAISGREARAQLVYDSFNYPAAATLDAKTNPINGQSWSPMSNNVADDEILLSSGSLSYPGLAASSGNAAGYAGLGKSERLSLERTARSGPLYYSLVLRVSALNSMTTSPTFIAGFSDRTGPSALPPTTVGTRLYLRQGATSTPGAETFNVGVSKNSGFDIAFDTTEYTMNTPLLVVGNYQIVGSGSGTDDVARMYINPAASSLGAASAPTSSAPGSPILTAPVAGTDLTVGGVPSLAGFVLRQGTGVPTVQVDELRVDNTWARVTPPTGVSWSVDNGGAWSESAKWSTLVSPNAADAFVNFNGVISGASTIDVDSAVALRSITFNSPQPYTLAAGGGAGALQFSANGGVNVRSGSHTIAAPISLAGDTLFSVATGAALNLTGNFTGNASPITKAGDGSLAMKHLRGGGADIVAGAVSIAPSGGDSGTSQVTSLSIGADASLDLSNNDLVVNYNGAGSPLGAPSGGVYSGLTGMIVTGENNGAWNGPGIRTSQADAQSGLTTLGIGEASAILGLAAGETAIWSGQSVDDTSVLVRYTYAGDANLDGFISGDDYSSIDFNVGTSAFGYVNGDFNYDGIVSGDDYSTIDFNFAAQGAPLGDSASASGVTAVPEPTGALAALMTIAGVRVLRRRRRPIA
jgi:hypothetical protein